MNTCNSVSRTNAARGVLLSSLIAAGGLFVEGRPGPTGVLVPRQTQTAVADDTDTDTDDDGDDEDLDEDGEDGPATHSHSLVVHSSGTRTWTSTLSSLSSGGAWSTNSLGTGTGTGTGTGSLPSGSGAGFVNPTGTGSGVDNEPSEATFSGGNAALSTDGGGISGGTIGGIVIGVGSILGIGFFLFRCTRRRRAMKKKRELMRRDLLLGPPYVRATHPTDIKDPQMTTANISSSRRSGLHRTQSRDTLPQIPFDTPAYMSTDNLASYTYAQRHMQRESTVMSYNFPDSADTTTVRESTGFGHASLHEELLARQKELEARMEHETRSTSSDWNHSVSTMNPPPPQYHEH